MNIKNLLNRLFLFLIIFIIMTGCSNDASDEQTEKLLKLLQSKGYVENNLNYVGVTYSRYGCNSLFGGLDYGSEYNVYEVNGKNYAINFDKIVFEKEGEEHCDFKIYVDYDVKYEEDNVSYIDSETNECDFKKEYIYKIDTNNERKFCVNRKKTLFGLFVTYDIKEFY